MINTTIRQGTRHMGESLKFLTGLLLRLSPRRAPGHARDGDVEAPSLPAQPTRSPPAPSALVFDPAGFCPSSPIWLR